METHIEDLATRGATVGNEPATMVLDVRVQPGGAADASRLQAFGETMGVIVRITEFP